MTPSRKYGISYISDDRIVSHVFTLSAMPSLPPLECLRFFDAAARHQSFARAAEELQVTAAAVAHRVKVLETHLGHTLFNRDTRRVTLNRRGKACMRDVQHILAEIREVIDRYQSGPTMRRLNVVVIESVAERWLMPKIADFSAAQPDIVIELETDHFGVDPNRHDFDIWITFDGGTKAPSSELALRETLFEDTLLAVCSPTLFDTYGRPRKPADLYSWPLLYHLGWPSDWTQWFASQGETPPDLSRASGFRLCSMLLHATLSGMGASIGRPTLIAPELEQGTLVPLFERNIYVPTQCYLMTTMAARRKPEVQAFREWIFKRVPPIPHPR